MRTFAMPGTGIPDFARHAALIAKAGVYDFAIHHDQILVPVILHRWGLTRLTGLSTAAEAARDSLLAYIERLGKVARRVEAKRDENRRSVDAA